MRNNWRARAAMHEIAKDSTPSTPQPGDVAHHPQTATAAMAAQATPISSSTWSASPQDLRPPLCHAPPPDECSTPKRSAREYATRQRYGECRTLEQRTLEQRTLEQRNLGQRNLEQRNFGQRQKYELLNESTTSASDDEHSAESDAPLSAPNRHRLPPLAQCAPSSPSHLAGLRAWLEASHERSRSRTGTPSVEASAPRVATPSLPPPSACRPAALHPTMRGCELAGEVACRGTSCREGEDSAKPGLGAEQMYWRLQQQMLRGEQEFWRKEQLYWRSRWQARQAWLQRERPVEAGVHSQLEPVGRLVTVGTYESTCSEGSSHELFELPGVESSPPAESRTLAQTRPLTLHSKISPLTRQGITPSPPPAVALLGRLKDVRSRNSEHGSIPRTRAPYSRILARNVRGAPESPHNAVRNLSRELGGCDLSFETSSDASSEMQASLTSLTSLTCLTSRTSLTSLTSLTSRTSLTPHVYSHLAHPMFPIDHTRHALSPDGF